MKKTKTKIKPKKLKPPIFQFDTVGFIDHIQRMREANVSYIDAVIDWCSSKGIEPEQVADFINNDPYLKLRITCEAEDLHYVKKGPRLPI